MLNIISIISNKIYKLIRDSYIRNVIINHKSYTFKIAENKKEKKEAYRLRHKIYCEEYKYCPKRNNGINLENDKYDEKSDIVIALNDENEVIGTIRLINNSNIGFQIEEYAALPEDIPKSNSIELSRLCVKRSYRGGRKNVALGLIKIIYKYSKKNNIKYWLAVLNLPSWKIFSKFGIPFSLIGEIKFWRYSKEEVGVIPVYLKIKKAEDVLKYSNPEFYKYITNKKVLKNKLEEKERNKVENIQNKIKNDIQIIENININNK